MNKTFLVINLKLKSTFCKRIKTDLYKLFIAQKIYS